MLVNVLCFLGAVGDLIHDSQCSHHPQNRWEEGLVAQLSDSRFLQWKATQCCKSHLKFVFNNCYDMSQQHVFRRCFHTKAIQTECGSSKSGPRSQQAATSHTWPGQGRMVRQDGENLQGSWLPTWPFHLWDKVRVYNEHDSTHVWGFKRPMNPQALKLKSTKKNIFKF